MPIPISAIASPLSAPSTAPSSMARAVPMPWAAEPSASPRARGLRIPHLRSRRGPTILPKMPTRKTTTEVTLTTPPSGSLMATAIGTVTDLGAMEFRIVRSAPNARAI